MSNSRFLRKHFLAALPIITFILMMVFFVVAFVQVDSSWAASTTSLGTAEIAKDSREFVPEQEAACSFSGLSGGGGGVVTRHCTVKMKLGKGYASFIAEIVTVFSDDGVPLKAAAFGGYGNNDKAQAWFLPVGSGQVNLPQKFGPQGVCRNISAEGPSAFAQFRSYQKVCFSHSIDSTLITFHLSGENTRGQAQLSAIVRIDRYGKAEAVRLQNLPKWNISLQRGVSND